MQNADFIRDFIEEASGHVESLETGLLKLEEGKGDEDTIHSVFRNVHSIKGTASFFDLKNIVNLAHVMENLFGEIRNGSLQIDDTMMDTLIASNDCLRNMITDPENSDFVDISGHTSKISSILDHLSVSNQQSDNKRDFVWDVTRNGQKLYRLKIPLNYNVSELIKKTESIGQVVGYCTEKGNVYISDGQTPSGTSCDLLIATVLEKSLLTLALNISDEDIAQISENDIIQEEFFQSSENGSFLQPPAVTANDCSKVDKQPAAEYTKEAGKKQNAVTEDIIRVHIGLLNELLNLASEMVLGRNQLLRILEADRKKIPGLNAVLQNVDNITTDLQEKIMQTRMQSISKVFNKFPRVIRELAKKMGKDIKLEMEGTGVELDKSIVEALGDPLTHLIRNASDHGIETPDIREEKSKPRTGTITLKAYHEGGYVNIDISDDGAGINIENVKEKALREGIIHSSELPGLGERELLELLFRPGFSTTEKVSDVSGRGVGMDVVKTNIEKLGGTMEITSNSGQGTTIRLTLPLTLAIISSLIVEAGGQRFALPQINLQGMLRIKPDDSSRKIENIRGFDVLRLRGRLLPLVHLADVLGLEKVFLQSSQVVRVLIVRSGSKRFGLVVDFIYDGEEILVKPIPRYMKDCQCYSGVTIMGDGRIAMILDPEGIASRANLRFMDDNKSDVKVVADDDDMAEQQCLLLFKCSGPEIFGIDLSMVTRVEEIQAKRIERIGKKEFIQFKGEALELIRPENYLPVAGAKKNSDKLYVIIPKLIDYPFGILIEEIINTIESKIMFNREDIKAKGLIGSAILDNRIVLFINIYELFEMAFPKDSRLIDSNKKLAGKTILLAEDTPFFAKTEKKYLESAGYHVLVVPNGKKAWKILQESKVDAVVSDIEMPEMDGLELVKRIRSNKKLAHLPVVAVTSKSDQRSINRGLEAGFDFYEVKLDKDRLLEKIRLAFQKRSDSI